MKPRVYLVPVILLILFVLAGCQTPETPLQQAEHAPATQAAQVSPTQVSEKTALPSPTPVPLKKASPQPTRTTAPPPAPPGHLLKQDSFLQSDKQRSSAPAVDPQDIQTLVSGNSAFLFRLYPLIQPKDKNFFFSPYSISEAMGMVYAGASGDTANQISDVMKFELPPEKLHPTFNAIDQELATHDKGEEGSHLVIANSLWAQKNRPFLQSYLDRLGEDYGAGIYLVDYINQTEEARNAINQWVNEKTEEKIPEIIAEGSSSRLTRMILVNAIYFKAAWETPFAPELSHRDYFFFLTGGQTMTDMMMQTDKYAYIKTATYEAIELPYKGGGVSMLIIMPTTQEFANVEKGLNYEFVNSVESALQPQNIALTMPRFKIESSFSLSEALIDMGILNAFAPIGANFSGIDGTRDLFLDKIAHKTFINVDENGTEAAAATAVTMKAASVESEQPLNVAIDHPFIFIIRSRQTNTILFVGRILNPAEK